MNSFEGRLLGRYTQNDITLEVFFTMHFHIIFLISLPVTDEAEYTHNYNIFTAFNFRRVRRLNKKITLFWMENAQQKQNYRRCFQYYYYL